MVNDELHHGDAVEEKSRSPTASAFGWRFHPFSQDAYLEPASTGSPIWTPRGLVARGPRRGAALRHPARRAQRTHRLAVCLPVGRQSALAGRNLNDCLPRVPL